MFKKTIGIFIGTVLASALLIAQQPQSARPEVCESTGKIANLNFTLKDINGEHVDLNAYKGNVILLDFWATWCPPCRKEIPGFVSLYDKYKTQGFVVLGVTVDDADSTVKKFVKQFKMNYPVLMGSDRDDLKKAFAPMPGYPTTLVIARDGKICSKRTGFVPLEHFEEKIKALL